MDDGIIDVPAVSEWEVSAVLVLWIRSCNSTAAVTEVNWVYEHRP